MGRAALLALAIAVTSCASKPPVVFGERMPSGCTKETRNERCFGWIFDRMLMLAVWKSYSDDDIRQYVESIGLRLAAASDEKRKWIFRVLDDEQTQAYSGFNSTIYLTRGVIAILRDEAELAAVIAHEMGHTIAGHNRESIPDFFSDAQVNEFRDRRYARDDEIQADELAVVMLARAGYDVTAVESMLRALGAGDDDEDASDNRHPIFRERIARAVALGARYPNAGERGVERFNARVAKLVVGPDPRALSIFDNVVLWARAGVAVELPEGSKMFSFGGIVFAVYPGEEIMATMQLVDHRIAKDMNDEPKPDVFTQTKQFGDHVLVIHTVQDDKTKHDLAAYARDIAARSRAPHAAERARLHPILFDPTVPRPLWSN